MKKYLYLLIYLDQLLPRIVELCQYCSNRQIRFIACEIFHAYIMLYLGNSKFFILIISSFNV